MNRILNKIPYFTMALALSLALILSAYGEEKSKDFSQPPKELDISQEEWDVLRLTNIERAKEGLTLLVTFDTVQKAAKIRARELGKLFDHTRPDGSDANSVLDELGYKRINSYTIFAENIAFGYGSAKDVVEAWMNSPGHRANILREQLRQLGVGLVGRDWAQVFVTDKESDAVSIDFNEELRYFTLKLKSGITAYAPYDPVSSPTVNGKLTFNYPGVPPIIPINAPDKTITSSSTSDPAPVVYDNVTAFPSRTNFVMNGRPVSVAAAYIINDTNYLQLRAIAALLNGTVAQFDVGWDGQYAIIQPGKPYSGEVTKTTLQATTNVRRSNTKFKLNGEVFNFEDARLIDGDTNYLQLREFAKKLSGTASQFNVYWDGAAGQAVIQPGVAYTGFAQ